MISGALLFQAGDPLHYFLIRDLLGDDMKLLRSADILVASSQRSGRKFLAGIVQKQRMRRGQQGRAFESAKAAQAGAKEVWRQQCRVGRKVELIAIGDHGVGGGGSEHGPKARSACAAQNDFTRL